MTDPTDREDVDATGAAPDDVAWFRAQVDPILDAEPIGDAWPGIEGRLLGDVPPLRSATTATRTRWIAVAAAIAILAAVTAALVATAHDDNRSVVADLPDPATGLYIPRSLPDGWRVRAAWVTNTPSRCPTDTRTWEMVRTGSVVPRITVAYRSCGLDEQPPAGDPAPALGPDVEDASITAMGTNPDAWLVRWDDDGAWTLRSEGFSESQVIEAARSLVADPVAAPLDGLKAASAGGLPPSPTGPTVTVSLVSPEGARVSYRLNEPGEGPVPGPFQEVEPTSIDGQALPVAVTRLRWEPEQAERLADCCVRSTSYTGSWPGAELTVPRGEPVVDDASAPGETTDPEAYDALLVDLIGHLRPATAGEWHAFLGTAQKRPGARLLRAEDLADIVGGGHRGTTDTTAVGSATTTTTSAASTTTDPAASSTSAPRHTMNDFGPVTSEPGRRTDRPRKKGRFSDLSGLEARLRLDRVPIRAGSPVPGVLLLRNPTSEAIELSECTWGLTQWGLVEDAGDQPPQHSIIDCYDAPVVTIPAGETVTRALDARVDPEFYAQRADDTLPWGWLGTLPGGDHLAVVDIPGDDEVIHIELPVAVADPPCPTSDAIARRYLGLSSDEAAARADADGLGFRVVRVDGQAKVVEDDLTCNRINVELRGGVVSNVLRY